MLACGGSSLPGGTRPVRDDQIRPGRPGRYLVPQRLRDGPRWLQLLRELLLPLA
ncbi:MAG TPA: hypothetical protein VGM12_22100 [Trebonia sp.]